MACSNNKGCGSSTDCPDLFNCNGKTPDFIIRRHDTKPAFKVKVEDCDGPYDLQGLVIEASMWTKGLLKRDIAKTATSLLLADNVGFYQVMIGDILVVSKIRSFERMLVVGINEETNEILVERGYHSTNISAWKKGSEIKIVKFFNAAASSESVFEDITQIDGTTLEDELTTSYLIYDWAARDTCLPGCYYLEFKIIKASDTLAVDSYTLNQAYPSEIFDYGCNLGDNVEWVRRLPSCEEGFIIKITDSPTAELL
jgi:hypothetical protein